MKTLLLVLVAIAGSAGLMHADDFGNRSKTVTTALETQLKKKTSEITAADLASVTELKLPHLHLTAFHDDDFAGLTNLKKLYFTSLFHRIRTRVDMLPPPFTSKVFANLSSLEELTITSDQLGSQLPDDVFAGLTSLKVLKLENVVLQRLPSSMLKLPKIEAIYYDGKGLKPEEYETLKKALGDKLHLSRP